MGLRCSITHVGWDGGMLAMQITEFSLLRELLFLKMPSSQPSAKQRSPSPESVGGGGGHEAGGEIQKQPNQLWQQCTDTMACAPKRSEYLAQSYIHGNWPCDSRDDQRQHHRTTLQSMTLHLCSLGLATCLNAQKGKDSRGLHVRWVRDKRQIHGHLLLSKFHRSTIHTACHITTPYTPPLYDLYNKLAVIFVMSQGFLFDKYSAILVTIKTRTNIFVYSNSWEAREKMMRGTLCGQWEPHRWLAVPARDSGPV